MGTLELPFPFSSSVLPYHQLSSMLDAIKQAADAVFSDVVRLRRTIHQNPELSREEHETARLVTETLEPLDAVSVQTGIYDTGIMATIEGDRPGPTSLLRADMDALPIEEETGLDFASENPGVMHACGHDAHTASLLGTAMILHRLRDRLHGSVRLVFQPAEERVPGGAQFMIDEGVLAANGTEAPESVFAQHVAPDQPSGTIGVCDGSYMASADEFYITVRGEGGHAASPHELKTDATHVAAHIVTALQGIVSRHRPPDTPGVLTVGKLTADGATNVIPETAYMEGTLRAMDEDWRFQAHDLIRRTAEHTAQAHGATVDVEVKVGYPALYNHEKPTALVREAAHDYVGPDRTLELDPWFAAEDFAFFLQERPGSFYRLGVGNEEKGTTHGLHTSQFDVDEEALRVAPGFMAYVAWKHGRNQR